MNGCMKAFVFMTFKRVFKLGLGVGLGLGLGLVMVLGFGTGLVLGQRVGNIR